MRRVLLPPGISVLVLTGLAMFGVGSRASAGFMYHAELAPAAGMADDDMAQTLNDSPSKAAPEVTPSVPAEPTPLRTVINPANSWSPSSGAGTSSGGSGATVVSSSFAQLPWGTAPHAPTLVTSLSDAQSEFIPDPTLSGIFHPPRPTARA